VLAVKRLLDIVGSGLALLLGLPFLAVVALLVYLDDPGPIFYTQTRVGQDGRLFRSTNSAPCGWARTR
jgi:lipopolysaccharide/colanic/teichoic acid biosynthesis glycosyltransferase